MGLTRKIGLATIVAFSAACTPPGALAQQDLEAFDGSWRLETGEVVTGGYMVEGDAGGWIFMDTRGLDRGGVFRRDGDALTSFVPPDGAVRIEVLSAPGGSPGFPLIIHHPSRRRADVRVLRPANPAS